MKNYSLLTPYIIPKTFKRKRVNIGDGLIVDSITYLLKEMKFEHLYSTKIPLSKDDILHLRDINYLIVAGANQINDNYNFINGTTIDDIKKISAQVIFMGVGYSGEPQLNKKMSENTKKILKLLLKDVKFFSCRCFRTVDYLVTNLPEYKDKFIMTGCPVVYGEKILSGHHFESDFVNNLVAVTITERGRNWFIREKRIIDYTCKFYSKQKKVLVLHQDFSENFMRSVLGLMRGELPKVLIRFYAKIRGMTIVVPKNTFECKEIYRKCDIHLGSRLHAHLYCLSICKRSFLASIDGRSLGISEYLGFPIIDFGKSKAEVEKIINNFDFEICRKNVMKYYEEMKKFINYLNKSNESKSL